jgi:uncharacterized protein
MPNKRNRLMLASVSFVLMGLVIATLLLASNKPPNMGWRDFLSDQKAAWSQDFQIRYDVNVLTRDGVTLKADLYLPRSKTKNLPTIYMRLPYGKGIYGESRTAARRFVVQGYAALVQDIRGRHGSGGQFTPYSHAADDGYDTIEWVIKQEWSNGKVGTFGCSALGEIQLISAVKPHPALKAMIVRGAGGAMGSAFNRYSYFGLFEGGIYNLASGAGWHSLFDPTTSGATGSGRLKPLDSLPIVELLGATNAQQYGNFERLLTLPLQSPEWASLGYLTDQSRITVPTLAFNTWYDQTIADSFDIKKLSTGPHPLIIGPGNHCTGDFAGEDNTVGELVVENPRAPELNFPYWETYSAWFAYWLGNSTTAATPLPNYQFFVLGENRWMQSEQWPPNNSQERVFYLNSVTKANSREGDGQLQENGAVVGKAFDEFAYDPFNPVPTRGGPICCVDDPKIRTGAVDQTDVESREDVLVYSTAPLPNPMRLVGPVQVQLSVSSSATDTDFIARLIDVAPSGKTLNIQEGALRLRYRDGYTQPTVLRAGERYVVTIPMRATAYQIKAGHRLRLQVTSSNFPRLERNLNTGGHTALENKGVVAINRVWYGGVSRLNVFVLPD